MNVYIIGFWHLVIVSIFWIRFSNLASSYGKVGVRRFPVPGSRFPFKITNFFIPLAYYALSGILQLSPFYTHLQRTIFIV